MGPIYEATTTSNTQKKNQKFTKVIWRAYQSKKNKFNYCYVQKKVKKKNEIKSVIV